MPPDVLGRGNRNSAPVVANGNGSSSVVFLFIEHLISNRVNSSQRGPIPEVHVGYKEVG